MGVLNLFAGRTGTSLAAAALLALAIAPPRASAARPERATAGARDTVAVLLRRRLADPASAGLRSADLVKRFYARREYAPAWSREAEVGAEAAALVSAIHTSESDGLRAEAYGLPHIEKTLRALALASRAGDRLEPAGRATLDLALSDAFLTYGTHLVRGRIDPRRVHPGWSLEPRRVDVVAVLEQALRSADVERRLAALRPSDAGYAGLRAALRRYRAMQAGGGWPAVPAGPTLRPGDRAEAVAILRERLSAEVPLPRGDPADFYDGVLESAVRAFQRSHGLQEDAVVGSATRAALNVDATARVRQLELGLERLRWLPADLGRRHVRIGIPAFELAVVEAGRTALAMRIVGGRPDWRTPIFSATMTSVVLSPYWNIPPSIASKEVVPEARRDPRYLDRHEIRVLVLRGSSELTVSSASIDWRVFDPFDERYRLRQDPGPNNPLGGVKFVFPNRYNVYLHDTPARHLFDRPERAFSHGCMRLERPLELAEYVLKDAGWDRAAIQRGMTAGAERAVPLAAPIPVHILYQTAWVDAAGTVQFRADLYGHDARLAAALATPGAAPAEPASGECAPAAP